MDNEFRDQVEDDLNNSSNDSTTKSDLRTLALRLELRIMKSETTTREYVYKLGWKFFGATIGTMGVMFTVFAMFLTSTLK